jgi:ATP/maltotriose-dependent transcriptional regulator MalT
LTERCRSCPHRSNRIEAEYGWFDAVSRVRELSEREREVFQLLAAGLSNRQIAERIWVAERTVKGHLAQIMVKLGVESRLQAGLAAFVYWLFETWRAVSACTPDPTAIETNQQGERRD